MLWVLRYCRFSLVVPPRHTTSGNLQYLRTQSTYDVLVLSYISQIHVFMSITDKTGALKVLWVPRFCPFAPKHPASLCNHMYMPLAGPLCKILGSIPGSLRPLGEPIGPLECPRAPAGSRTITPKHTVSCRDLNQWPGPAQWGVRCKNGSDAPPCAVLT